MSVSSMLKKAVEGIAPVQAGTYLPKDPNETYIVFNYYTLPADYADDEPGHEIIYAQVHLFCPAGKNSLVMRRKIKKAVHEAGFTFPSTVDATDADGQHHIFECTLAVVAGGE